jgi:predicted Zn-dependent protease
MSRHPATPRHVSYALGYIGLGMWKEALLELESIAARDQLLPEVLSVRIDFHLEAKEWEKLVEAGSRLAKSHPSVELAWIGWAYALRELNQVREARKVLLEAEVHHGKTSAVMHYNLACYESLLGAISSARARLATACRMDQRFIVEGKRDPDLKSLRDAESGIK